MSNWALDQLSPRYREQIQKQLANSPLQAKARPQKFNAMRTTVLTGANPLEVNGVVCDSKKEAGRYMILLELQHRGEITSLIHQGRVSLDINGVHVCDFEPDFMYQTKDGKLNAEDVKGMKKGTVFMAFMLKARIFEAIYGTEVKVI